MGPEPKAWEIKGSFPISEEGSVSYKNIILREEEAGAEKQEEGGMLIFELGFLIKGRRRKTWEAIKMEDEELAASPVMLT